MYSSERDSQVVRLRLVSWTRMLPTITCLYVATCFVIWHFAVLPCRAQRVLNYRAGCIKYQYTRAEPHFGGFVARCQLSCLKFGVNWFSLDLDKFKLSRLIPRTLFGCLIFQAKSRSVSNDQKRK